MAEKYNDDILEQAAERFKEVSEQDQRERELADDDTRFASNDEGCQWPSDLRTEREEDGRPCIVINKIAEKIDQVDGEFKQLQPSFKVRAIDSQADPKVAEVISGLMRHIEYNSSARNSYNTSHNSTLCGGRGAWRIEVVEAEDDPWVRDIKIGRIPNPLTVYWDQSAKALDLSDAQFMFVTELVPKKEFEKDHKDTVENWPSGEQWDKWRTEKSYRIAEYWWKEKTKKTFYRVKRGNNIVTVEELGPMDQLLEQKEVDRPVVKWCKMTAKKIIEGPETWAIPHIPIIVERGKITNIQGQDKTRGMTRHAKDPQRMYNYWSAQNTEQMALVPKSPYIGLASHFAPYQNLWDQAHKKNFPYLPIELDDRAPGLMPQRQAPPQVSSAMQGEFLRMEHDIMSATGIYAANLGDQGQEVSGRAIMARQRQGNIGSYPYTDSFNVAYTYSCKQIVQLIPKVYDTERVVRIVGSDGQENMVPVNARPNLQDIQNVPEDLRGMPQDEINGYFNDLNLGKYDVAVSVGPSYTTQREETFAILMDMMRTVPQAAGAIIDLVASNLDVPKHSEEIVKRLKKMVPVGIRDLEPGEQPPQQQPNPDMLKMQLEMEKLRFEKEKSDRDLDRKEFEAKMKAIADLTTAESKEIGNQVSQMTAVVEQFRKNMEMQEQRTMQQVQMAQDMQTRGNEQEMSQRDMALREQQAQQVAPTGQIGEEEPQEGIL